MSADFFASYLSGAAGILIGNPLDVLKTRLQASVAAPSTSSPPVPATAAPATAGAGNFTSFSSYLRGAPAPLLGYGALNALLFVTYNRCLSLLGEADFQNPQSLAKIWAAGAAGGLASFVVSAPTELVKCRVQVQSDHSPSSSGGGAASQGQQRATQSSWAVARDVIHSEGVRGLYFGGGITAVRDAVGYGFYFWSYELAKRAWPSSPEASSSADGVKVLVCGGIAGVVTWASIFPLDVVKTRVQTQSLPSSAFRASPVTAGESQALLGSSGLSHPNATKQRRLGAWEVARHAYANEGVAVFFRGLGVCSVRAFIVNAVQWAVYEWMMELLLRQRGDGGRQKQVI